MEFISKISENIGETPEGFLVCLNVLIAKAGEYGYLPSEVKGIEPKDGKVMIYRSEETLKKSVTSFEGKPITLLHPISKEVTAKNWKDLAIGHASNVRYENGLYADLVINDKEAADRIKSGDMREVSCGYDYTLKQVKEGHGEITDIVGNHVAIVNEARCGEDCTIIDSKPKGEFMKLKEQLKAMFQKAVDSMPEELEPEKKQEQPKSEEPKKEPEIMADEATIEERVANIEEQLDAIMEFLSGEEEGEPQEGEPQKMGDGDFEGHPFRGNQHSEGTGGGAYKAILKAGKTGKGQVQAKRMAGAQVKRLEKAGKTNTSAYKFFKGIAKGGDIYIKGGDSKPAEHEIFTLAAQFVPNISKDLPASTMVDHAIGEALKIEGNKAYIKSVFGEALDEKTKPIALKALAAMPKQKMADAKPAVSMIEQINQANKDFFSKKG